MTKRSILSWTAAGAVLVLVVIWCCITGKAYDIIVENRAAEWNGERIAAFEAIEVSIDSSDKRLYLLEDDREVGNAVGRNHTLIIELLDAQDKPYERLTVPFAIVDLGEKRILNVPLLAAQKAAQVKREKLGD